MECPNTDLGAEKPYLRWFASRGLTVPIINVLVSKYEKSVQKLDLRQHISEGCVMKGLIDEHSTPPRSCILLWCN